MIVVPGLWLEYLEIFLAAGSIALAFFNSKISAGLDRYTGKLIRRISARPAFAMAFVAASPLLVRLVLLPWMAVPLPSVQEEFSNLLLSDTLNHRRLANPAHPMAAAFDNVQIPQGPHYVSGRLPGQALFMWIGQLLFGHPWWGVWLSVGLTCAAFYWMLLGWTNPRWAFAGGLLFAIRLGVFSYWMNSYWSPAVTALGGALVLGGLRPY